MTTNNQTANTTQAIDSQSQTAPTAQNTLTQSQQDLLFVFQISFSLLFLSEKRFINER